MYCVHLYPAFCISQEYSCLCGTHNLQNYVTPSWISTGTPGSVDKLPGGHLTLAKQHLHIQLLKEVRQHRGVRACWPGCKPVPASPVSLPLKDKVSLEHILPRKVRECSWEAVKIWAHCQRASTRQIQGQGRPFHLMGTRAAVQSIKMQGIFGDLQVIQDGQKRHCRQGIVKATAGKQASAYPQWWHMACSEGLLPW